MKNRITFIYAVIVISIAGILFGSVSLIYPYARDQGIYAYVGNTILEGGAPYKDAWDFKPPAIYYLYALSSFLFGKNMISIRIFEIIWQISTAILLYFIANLIIKHKITCVSISLIYLFLFYINDYWNTAQSESFITLPLATAVYFFLINKNKQKLYFYSLSGFLLGLAVLFKYQFGLLFILMAGITILKNSVNEKNKEKENLINLRIRIIRLSSLLFGFLSPIVTIIFILFLQNALHDFIITEFVITPGYVKLSYDSVSLVNIAYKGGIPLYIVIFLMVLIPLFLYFQNNLTKKVSFIIGWAIVCFLSIFLQGKYFIYHFIPILAPLILLSIHTLYSFFNERKYLIKKLRLVFISVSLITVAIIIHFFYLDNIIALTLNISENNRIESQELDLDLYGNGDFSYLADKLVAQYIKRNTLENQTIYIWGFEPIIYFLSNRKCPSRFIYNTPLYWSWTPPEYKNEFIEVMLNQKPEYFIIVKNDPVPFVSGDMFDSEWTFNKYEKLVQIIKENYKFEISIEDFKIYRLKN